MKSIDELDHYELLEIPRSVSRSEIDRAYRTAQQTYAEGSLALYSVFEGRDAAGIRKQIDEAYRVLADPESRELYDRALAEHEPSSSSGGSIGYAAAHSQPLGWEDENAFGQADGAISDYSSDAFEDVAMEYEAFDENAGGDFDGTRLRKTRLFRGYELEDISEVTKVSGAHLRNIEEENFRDLPADVYVRGFVTAYAKTIGLDPYIVVPSYMSRIQESREGSPRGRFMGRR